MNAIRFCKASVDHYPFRNILNLKLDWVYVRFDTAGDPVKLFVPTALQIEP
ncbi:MAG TPA: hypothetical protein VEM96_00015 [Pyrinomonadaceae bacterium]|nr:hypothetical protein [Pyrinomonadaceae bacterium]